MLKKLLHIILILCVFFAVIIAALIASFRFFLPEYRIRRALETQVRGWTMRESRIGRVSVSFFRGIEVEDFSLASGNDFRSGVMLRIRKIRFIPEILPAFRGEAKISGLIIESPELVIRRNEFNIRGIAETIERIKTPSRPPKYAPMLFLMNEFRVDNGKITFRDDKHYSVESINILSRGFSKGRPSKADLSFVMTGKSGAVDVDSDIILDFKNARITLESFLIKNKDGNIDITGRITGFDDPELDLALKGGNNAINCVVGQLFGFPRVVFGKGDLNLRVTGTFDNIKIKEQK